MNQQGLTSLSKLFCSLFSTEEFRRFVATLAEGEKVARSLPGSAASLCDVVEAGLGCFERRGLINDALFRQLGDEFPGRSDEISAAQTAWRKTCLTRGATVVPRSVPGRPAHFVPRPALSRQIGDALRGGTTTCAAIYALDGLGKTTMLAGLIHELIGELGEQRALLFYGLDRRRDLDLAQIYEDLERSQGQRAPAFLAETDEGDGRWADADAVATSMARLEEVWIVVDDFHRLLADDGSAAREIEALFVDVPVRLRIRQARTRLRILLASTVRPSLRVASELVFTPVVLGPMSLGEATSLLCAGTGVDAGSPVARALAESAACIPSWLMPIAEYIRQEGISPECALLKLRQVRHGVGEERQQHLVRLAVARLSRSARAVLDALSVFSGPVSRDVLRRASRVESDEEFGAALEEIERGLVAGKEQGNWDMPTFFKRALTQMLTADERRQLHRQAADALTSKLSQKPREWRSRADAEPHLDRLDHLCAAEDWQRAFDAFVEIHANGLARLGLHRRKSDLAFQLAAHMAETPARAAACLRSGAIGLMRLGEYAEAHERIESAEAFARESNDHRELSLTLNARGMLAFNERCIEEARCLYEESLQLGNDHDLPKRLQAVRHANIAECCLHSGEFAEADDHVEIVLGIYADVDPWETSYLATVGDAWCYRAQVHLACGELRAAMYCIDTAVAIGRGNGDLWQLGSRLDVRGTIALRELTAGASDAFQRAESSLQDAIDLLHQTGVRRREAVARLHLAQTYHFGGQISEARDAYEKVLQFPDDATRFAANVYLGVLCLAEGEHARARTLIRAGNVHCDRVLKKSRRDYEAHYARALACAAEAWLSGDSASEERAIEAYRRALEVTSAKGVQAAAARALDLLPPVSSRRRVQEAIHGLFRAPG